MPELPDIVVYLDAIERRAYGRPLRRLRLGSPFVLRSVDPPMEEVEGRTIESVDRLGKRIVIGLDGDLFIVIHLMIAGRLRWREPGAAVPRRSGLAALDLDDGTILLTEAGTKRRASLHLVRGRAGLAPLNPGGIDVPGASSRAFREALRRERHTLKRALTDPRIFSGIGNAYSDEILHRARLSPFKMTDGLDDLGIERLRRACDDVLTEWIQRLRDEAAGDFPEKVTAFRSEMAVHGRYRRACPVCGTSVQRIVHAENESNYCPRCQTGGKILADRALSRLLHDDWPRSLEELEDRGLGVSPASPSGSGRRPRPRRR